MLGIIASAISAIVALRAWQHRTERGVRSFLGLVVALSAWSLVYGVQLGFPTRAGQLPWQALGLAIGGTIPPLWFSFTVKYAGRDNWLSRPLTTLLIVEPVLFALFTITNPSHGLIWESATLTRTPTALDLVFNTGYYIHILWAYLLVIAGLASLVSLLIEASSLYRQQTSLLILGALPPFLVNILYTLQISWGPIPAVDLTPFAFAFTGVVFGLALFQFDLLQRTPIAREQVLEQMGDGFIVLDTEGIIVDTNRVAHQAFESPPNVGEPVTELVEEGQTLDAALEALDGRTITTTITGTEHTYDIEWSELTGRAGDSVGHVLGVRDVTERNQYEQRLEVTQRVLRHNLRNEMTVIQGWADYLARETTNSEADAARRIADTADDLIELSEKTRTMTRLGQSVSQRTSLDVRAEVSSVVEEFRREHPEATVSYETTGGGEITLTVPNEELFEIPVRNLIENAIEHNDENPRVRVRVSQDADLVRIQVADNAPEIPEMEQAVLKDGSEEPLQHGSGVGLWLTYWSIKIMGGRISFDTSEPQGNVVTLEFPRDGRDEQVSYILIDVFTRLSATSPETVRA